MTRILAFALFAALSVTDLSGQPRRRQTGAPEPPPHLLMERLSRMPAEERDRIFAKLPPGRRAVVEQRIEKYNQLPGPQKERLREEYNQFQRLTPEKQEEVRKLFREFSEIPEERRKVVRRELHRLRTMPRGRFIMRTNSEAFRVEFSESERRMLEGLVTLLSQEPPPEPTATK